MTTLINRQISVVADKKGRLPTMAIPTWIRGSKEKHIFDIFAIADKICKVRFHIYFDILDEY